MDTTHIKAKLAAINPPEIITTHANPANSLVKYQELTSAAMHRKGVNITALLNQIGLMKAWLNMKPTMKKINVTPNR